MNRTVTSANRDRKIPSEVWRGKPTKLQVLPLLQPSCDHRKRTKKYNPMGAACFPLGPSPNHTREMMLLLNKQRLAVITIRDISWRAVMLSPAYVPPHEKGGGWVGGNTRDSSTSRTSEPGGQADDATSSASAMWEPWRRGMMILVQFRRRQSKGGVRRMALRPFLRRRIMGGRALDDSAHARFPAQSGHRTVPLLERRLTR